MSSERGGSRDVVSGRASPTQRIEFVEQVDAPNFLNRVEDQAELRSRLAQVFCDEAVKLDCEQWETKSL